MLWSQANEFLIKYCNAQVESVDKELWEGLKKHGEELGKHYCVEQMIVIWAFLGKAGELQQSINCLLILVCFNLQFQLLQVCDYSLSFCLCIDNQVVRDQGRNH